ncbi:hypothetical protein P154DRAFT_51431 [Amniculicola lignicola CBS 123094]|uniref:Uncharacterized protein n=1 Tax=Amniculicola lignicola CBS 123094 TaxID=1392246 RepID=A0A6A5WR98_9PLEO|nr:hypothetical protein P154DRAFT_51431 [Amniculicola lignicola CBS 123094]
MDGDLGFGFSSSHQKRTHNQMENDGTPSPTWPTLQHHRLSVSREPSVSSHPQVSGLHLPPHFNNMPPAPQRRYPGDGLDFRRPAGMARNDSPAAVIDLTADDAGPSASSNSRPSQYRPTARAQRGPRHPRDIINIDEDDSLPPPPDSPEIEFISSRRLDPPTRRDPPSFTIPDEEDAGFEITGVQAVPEERRRRGQFEEMMGMLGVRGNFEGRPPVPPPRGQRHRSQRGHGHVHVGFIPPDLNFDMVGFDMVVNPPAPAPPPPTYDAPVAAPEGFTRSPVEDDVLVCPNCGDELCTGDTDQKKQVWIVKGCGHAYCGECQANKTIKRTSKGKEKISGSSRSKPFKQCCVDGCESKTNTRGAMFQVFL